MEDSEPSPSYEFVHEPIKRLTAEEKRAIYEALDDGRKQLLDEIYKEARLGTLTDDSFMQDTFCTVKNIKDEKPKMPKTDENQNLTDDDWWSHCLNHCTASLMPTYLQSKSHKVYFLFEISCFIKSFKKRSKVQRMSDEDDYMSDAFLKSLEDKRPGLIHGKKAQQLMKEEKIR